MKKILGILLAVMMLFATACAIADEVPQPEGGKKFESDWAVPGGIIEVYYEEEGYRVFVKIEQPDALAGAEFEYSCYYQEETDSLISVSSIRSDYTVDPDTGDEIYADEAQAYEGIDEEGKETVFTIDGDGFLIWKDGHDDAGAGLKFVNIGQLDGVWKNEEAGVEAEFEWNGLADPETFEYTVYVICNTAEDGSFRSDLLTGTFDPASGKLTATGTGTVFTRNASGEYDSADDETEIEAVFSFTEDGKLLYENSNIVLEYDLLGGSQG